MPYPTLQDWLERGPFTLALSSSFFGFYAHCGVAEALFQQGCIPRKITGSSAGALVGGALSSGLSPQEAKKLLFEVRKEHFWDPGIGFGLLKGQKFLDLLEANFVKNFEDAKIPLEVAAFELTTLRTRFLRDGSLPKAIVASCAVPLMFHPVRIGMRVYLDGGVFHKSGIQLEHSEERTLSVFLVNDRLLDAFERGKGFGTLGENQKVLRLRNLPNVDPNRLDEGKFAYEKAFERVRAALKLPLRTTILDG